MDVPIMRALAQRGNKADRGITDTLRSQAEHGSSQETKGPAHHKKQGPRPETTCWCERTVVLSTWDKIAKGDGESCGARKCHPPTEGQTK